MKTTLYLGTDPSHFERQGHAKGHLIHYPVIKIAPRPLDHPEIQTAYANLENYTHLIFTSKNAVKVFFGHLSEMGKDVSVLRGKTLIAIGEVTAAHLRIQGCEVDLVAHEETQEGIIQMLQKHDLKSAYVFLPRSAIARSALVDFLEERGIRYHACDVYDTVTHHLLPEPDLSQVDEIVFTSPSTVKAFMEIFGKLPRGKKLLAIGPITEQSLLTLSHSHR